MPQNWTPPSYAEPTKSEWTPPSYAEAVQQQKPEEESFFTKARNFMFNPLLPSNEDQSWESNKSYGQNIPIINKIWPGGISLPTGHEVYRDLIRPISAPIGLLTLGMEGLINKSPTIPKEEPLPVRQPKLLGTRLPEVNPAPTNTGFIGGEAGIAQSGRTYPLDLGPNRIPTLENGTILPREYGEVNQIPPSLAARQGLEVGKPARAPLESPNPNLKLLNRAPDFVSEEEGIRPVGFEPSKSWTPPEYAEPISPVQESVKPVEPIKPAAKPISQVLEDFQQSLRDKGIIKPKLQEEAIPEFSTNPVIDQLKKLVSSEEGSLDVERMKQLLKDNAERFGKMDWYKSALAKIDDGDYGAASRIIKSSLLPPEEGKMSYRDLMKRYANFDGNRNKEVPISPDTTPITDPSQNPALGKLMNALNEAGPQRQQQEALYSMERARRINAAERIKTPGLEGFYKQLGKLKGEFPKIDPSQYDLTEGDFDSLIDNITNSQRLLPFEKIRAKTGLVKLLTGEEVPQQKELSLLGEVFGNEFSQLVMMHGGLGGPIPLKVATEFANLSKSLTASMDLSAPFRQGLGLVHRSEYWKAFGQMFSMAKSEDAFQGVMDSIYQRPNYLLGREAGLALTDIGVDLSQREEAFLSKYAEKIPGIRPSERAYVGFLNKLRSDTFDTLVDNAQKAGLDISQGSNLSRQIARYVNVATGRGDLGRFSKVGTELNALIFSPRLIASRLTTLNPNYYLQADPFVRKEALKTLLSIGAFGATTLALNNMAGGTTSKNVLAADFGKAKEGDTRLDPWGGFQQYIVAAARLMAGKTDSNATGVYATTRTGIAEQFAANKLSPIASFVYTLGRAKTVTDRFGNTKHVDPYGNEVNVPAEVMKRYVPLVIQDLYDLYQSDPNLLPMGIGAAFGMGMQTYNSEPKPRLRFSQ